MGESGSRRLRDHWDHLREPSFSMVVLCEPSGRPMRLCASMLWYRWSMPSSCGSASCGKAGCAAATIIATVAAAVRTRADFNGDLESARLVESVSEKSKCNFHY